MNHTTPLNFLVALGAFVAVLLCLSCDRDYGLVDDRGKIQSLPAQNTIGISRNAGATTLFVRDIAFDRSNNLYVSTASPDSLFKSTNGGLTWIPLPTPGPAIAQIAVNSKGSIVVQSNRDKIFLSTDGGFHWSLQHSSMGAFTMSFDQRDTLWVGLSGLFDPGVARSLDLGHTWIASGAGLGVYTTIRSLAFLSSGIYFASGDEHQTQAVTSRSTDFGNSWQSAAYGAYYSTGQAVQSTYADSTGLVIAGYSADLSLSTDLGLTWTRKYTGLPTSVTCNVSSIAVTAKRWIVITIPTEGIYYSQNLGDTWNKLQIRLSGATPNKVIKTLSGDIFLATSGAGIIYLAL